MEIARTELDQVLADLAQNEVKKIRQLVQEKLGEQERSLEVRKVYATMEPLQIISDLMDICREICQSKRIELEIFSRINERCFSSFVVSKDDEFSTCDSKRFDADKYLSNSHLSWSIRTS